MLIVELFEDSCPPDDRIVTYDDLRSLEKYLDEFFKRLHIDVNITGRHFIERVNDQRNSKQITICELRAMFSKFYKEHVRALFTKTNGFQGVIKDLNTELNLPFLLKYNERKREIELIAKTVMRKKDYKTTSEVFPLGSSNSETKVESN